MFDRLDETAQAMLTRSRDEAHGLGHDFIAPAHFILAVLSAEGSVPVRALRNKGGDLETFRTSIVERMPRRPATDSSEMLPFTPGSKLMLEAALVEAGELQQTKIGVEHLFLGALRADDSRHLGEHVARAFRNVGVKPEDARAEVLRLLATE
jgi:ATP-dependent Clp protease ATP-binding subunit ClpC